MPDEREKEADTGETPDGARVRTVNCPACTVAYDASLDSCPRCGAPVPGRPPKTVFPMEVGRFPRPWKAFPAAYELLLHPRTSWPSIGSRGKRVHAAVFCITWAVFGALVCLVAGSLKWDLPGSASETAQVLLILGGFGIAVQIAVLVVVRLCCLLWWIPAHKANASVYAAGLTAVSLTFTFVMFALFLDEIEWRLSGSLALFGVLRIDWESLVLALLTMLPSALLLCYTLFGFYRWRVGLKRRRAVLLGVLPPLLVMLVICYLFAEPRVLR